MAEPDYRQAGLVDLPASKYRQACLPAGRRKTRVFYTYAIKSKVKNYIYVGITNKPERRIAEHNSKKAKTTRFYAPFKTILIEKYGARFEARKREKYLKSGAGKEYLRSL